MSCMTTLRSLVYPLAGKCSDPEAKKALTEMADGFYYSDPVSGSALKTIESELEEMVSELLAVVSNGNGEQVISMAKKTSVLYFMRGGPL